MIVKDPTYYSNLVIKDPLNPGSNICKSAFKFTEIQAAFAEAHARLTEAFNQYDGTYQVNIVDILLS